MQHFFKLSAKRFCFTLACASHDQVYYCITKYIFSFTLVL